MIRAQVLICGGTGCTSSGSKKIRENFESEIVKQGLQDEIKIVQTVAGEPVCYPIRKGEQTASLLEAINSFLKQARQDGTLSALSVKYFGTDLTKAN